MTTSSAAIPCLRAFMRDLFRPPAVRGPVLFVALRRLALVCCWFVMYDLSWANGLMRRSVDCVFSALNASNPNAVDISRQELLLAILRIDFYRTNPIFGNNINILKI